MSLSECTAAYWRLSRTYRGMPDSQPTTTGKAINLIAHALKCVNPLRPVAQRLIDLQGEIIYGGEDDTRVSGN